MTTVPILPPRERIVIAVDGPSGAGKTTLAHRLADAVRRSGGSAGVVSMDDLYPGWDGLEAGVDILTTAVLVPYAAGAASLSVPTWDWATDSPGPLIDVSAPDLLIVEGVGSGARRCASWLGLLIWVDAPESARYRYAMARDGDTYRPYWRRWAAAEHAHFAREGTPDRADAAVGLL